MTRSSSDYGASVLNIIGAQIRRQREQIDLTQSELSARCNLLEWDLSRSTLAKIESGVRRVTDKEVLLLAEALSVDVTTLFEQVE